MIILVSAPKDHMPKSILSFSWKSSMAIFYRLLGSTIGLNYTLDKQNKRKKFKEKMIEIHNSMHILFWRLKLIMALRSASNIIV